MKPGPLQEVKMPHSGWNMPVSVYNIKTKKNCNLMHGSR